MSVREYFEGEHPGGFVGFRVVRTVGSGKGSYRQKYFSTNRYEYEEASELAFTLDRQWKALALEESKQGRVKKTKPRINSSSSCIAEGLRAYISTETKFRAGERRTYFTPCFLVKKVGRGQSDIQFRITTHGYHRAYVLAAKRYAEIHSLSTDQQLALLAVKPDRSLFTGDLLKGLRKRGHILAKATLLAQLDS